jgi:hypothetical protein
MRYPSPALKDIRQIGPKRDRNISGICSACGTALLAWLQDSETAKPSLPDRLDVVFKAHVAECHPRPATHARRFPAA